MFRSSRQMPGLSDGMLPVFVFPTSLTFYSKEQQSHKQVLTLYNPYDTALRFKVLCTAPKRFSVVESEGHVKPKCCVDIVIRHNEVSPQQEGVQDKFRIQVYEQRHKKVIGKKDILAVLYRERDSLSHLEDNFQTLSSSRNSTPERRESVQQATSVKNAKPSNSGPSLVIILTAVVCICALLLPTIGDINTRLPSYMVLTVNQKLIAAYVLGLVTMVLLQS